MNKESILNKIIGILFVFLSVYFIVEIYDGINNIAYLADLEKIRYVILVIVYFFTACIIFYNAILYYTRYKFKYFVYILLTISISFFLNELLSFIILINENKEPFIDLLDKYVSNQSKWGYLIVFSILSLVVKFKNIRYKYILNLVLIILSLIIMFILLIKNIKINIEYYNYLNVYGIIFYSIFVVDIILILINYLLNKGVDYNENQRDIK